MPPARLVPQRYLQTDSLSAPSWDRALGCGVRRIHGCVPAPTTGVRVRRRRRVRPQIGCGGAGSAQFDHEFTEHTLPANAQLLSIGSVSLLGARARRPIHT